MYVCDDISVCRRSVCLVLHYYISYHSTLSPMTS